MTLKRNTKMSPEKIIYTAETGNWERQFFKRHQNNTDIAVDYLTLKKKVMHFSFRNVPLL